MKLQQLFKVFLILSLQLSSILMSHSSESSRSAPEHSPKRYESTAKFSNLFNDSLELRKNVLNLSSHMSQLSDYLAGNITKLSDDLFMFSSETSNKILELSKKIDKFSEKSSDIDSELSRNVSKLSADVSKLLQNLSVQSHETSTLSSNRYNSSQLYVFGGETTALNYLSSASHYNSSTGKWQSTTDMSLKRAFGCGVAVGTKIYLFGGEVHTSIERSQVYDSETGTYSPYRSLPRWRNGCGAAVLGDYIYVAGGWDHSRHLSEMIRYNIHTTRIETLSPMSIERTSIHLLELNGRLYAVGGFAGTSQALLSYKAVEVYNPKTDRWSIAASTHYAHQRFGAAVHERKIYVCSDTGFEVYSPETDQWRILTMPNNYHGRKLVSMNGKLWALGGGPAGSKSVFTYDTVSAKWNEQPDMNEARRYHLAFVVNH